MREIFKGSSKFIWYIFSYVDNAKYIGEIISVIHVTGVAKFRNNSSWVTLVQY